MPVPPPAVAVRGPGHHVDEIQQAMPNPALGDDFLRKPAHALHRPLEDDGLETLIVIEMCVHGRDDEFMLGVLNGGQTLR